MSALGQKQTFKRLRVMSALPPKADIAECDCNVRFVPKVDSCIAVKERLGRLEVDEQLVFCRRLPGPVPI